MNFRSRHGADLSRSFTQKWEASETQRKSQSPNVATSRDAQRRSVLVLLAMENETTSDGSMEFNPTQLLQKLDQDSSRERRSRAGLTLFEGLRLSNAVRP